MATGSLLLTMGRAAATSPAGRGAAPVSRIAGVTALVAFLSPVGLAACGSENGKVVEADKAERGITQKIGPQIERQLHHSISSVSCPDGLAAKNGTKFTCTLKTDNGVNVRVDALVLNVEKDQVLFTLESNAAAKISRGG